MRSSLLSIGLLAITLPALAHFGMLLPKADYLDPGVDERIVLAAAFGHPADGHLLGGEQPTTAGVVVEGRHQLLSAALTRQTDDDGMAWWSIDYPISEPGDHIFYVNPSPYWEPSEDLFIAHHVKTLVTVGDGGEGWHQALGPAITPAELVPLTRPNGLYVGNAVRLVAHYHGKAVPGVIVEVERCHWQQRSGPKLQAPTPLHLTQELKTDAQGIVTFTPPSPGWWGVSALIGSEQQAALGGQALSLEHPELGTKEVEIGAVLWFYAHPLPAP